MMKNNLEHPDAAAPLVLFSTADPAIGEIIGHPALGFFRDGGPGLTFDALLESPGGDTELIIAGFAGATLLERMRVVRGPQDGQA